MCDRFSITYGYICGECFQQLVQRGPGVDIKKFMNEIPCIDQDEMDAYCEYSREFELR